MAAGGYRPGAGRPKTAKTPREKAKAKAPADVRKAARSAGLNPLDYMLGVMNDAGADDARRDRMAIAAAPFVHVKPGDTPKGKKEQAQDEAGTAGEGTGWGNDLATPAHLN